MARGRFEQAQKLFQQTVAAANEHGDKFLEAGTLLDLSNSGLQQEHFDQALEWANAAYQKSAEIEAVAIAQVALGNQGWAYFRLGEAERAFGSSGWRHARRGEMANDSWLCLPRCTRQRQRGAVIPASLRPRQADQQPRRRG